MTATVDDVVRRRLVSNPTNWEVGGRLRASKTEPKTYPIDSRAIVDFRDMSCSQDIELMNASRCVEQSEGKERPANRSNRGARLTKSYLDGVGCCSCAWLDRKSKSPELGRDGR